jgi:hypothetical protein
MSIFRTLRIQKFVTFVPLLRKSYNAPKKKKKVKINSSLIHNEQGMVVFAYNPSPLEAETGVS